MIHRERPNREDPELRRISKVEVVPSLYEEGEDFGEILNSGERIIYAGRLSKEKILTILVGSKQHTDLGLELGLTHYPKLFGIIRKINNQYDWGGNLDK